MGSRLIDRRHFLEVSAAGLAAASAACIGRIRVRSLHQSAIPAAAR